MSETGGRDAVPAARRSARQQRVFVRAAAARPPTLSASATTSSASRKMLEHGEFLKWIEFAMTPRTGQNFMRVAGRLGKYEAASHLPATALYGLAAPSTSGEVVQQAVTTAENGDHVCLAEVREMAAKRKAERCATGSLPHAMPRGTPHLFKCRTAQGAQ